MLRYLYPVIIFILVSANLSFASKIANPVKPKVVLKTDSTAITVRTFDTAALKAYSKQPEFQYNETNASSPSLWVRFWRWFWHFFDFIDFSKNHSAGFFTFIKYLFILLGAAALIFFIFKLAGIDMSNIFRRKSQGANLPYAESLENIHEINFDAEIEKASSQHNYRLAVRLLYLKCLKQLSDASLIKWQLEKTNSIYINELENIDQRSAFKLLTRQFEYVWYGEFAIDGAIFKQINLLFNEFKSKLS